MPIFENWDWNSILRSAVGSIPAAISGFYGARQVARANRAAAEIAARNQAANIAEIRQANERAAAMLRPLADVGTPGIEYMHSIMARSPYQFSPAQQIELEDRRRAAIEMIPPSLRGAGRFRTAAINDVLNRARAGMIAENQARQDRAAQALAGTGTGALSNIASFVAGQGPQIARENTAAAEAMANALTGTAASNATTMGQIASFFANAMRDNERASRYRGLKPGGV
jgi:hypothetical protein